MTIALPPELEQFLESQVAAGRYGSIDEAACVAVRILQRREFAAAELRARIAEAEAEVARGEGIVLQSDSEIDAFFDDLLAEDVVDE